ncbi:hypothetical protein RDWZM_005326 [Blomia tropicalis]|uniref:MIF4G domain-containing protein n=1 Tax=Blomia tropicalis TaxID=40697 RepID=A0A9Q0M5Q4_BLOTA|nr:hypothetical protein RDWZM_005326 [Blomia tropicalis]
MSESIEVKVMDNEGDLDVVENENREETKSDKDGEQEQLEQINLFIDELNVRFQQKREERSMHDPKNFDYPDESFFVKLDSSIKKNSAFVKKLKNMTETQRDNIMKDLATLNLSRYVSEIATALVETKIKLTEITMCVKICSFLHLRYQDFSAQLLDSWIKNLPRKATDQFNASKMRIDIRLFTELILTRIFTTKDALPLLGNLLTILTNSDKESHNNLAIILGFCRQYANEFAGLIPRKMKLLAEKFNLTVPICDFLTVERQRGVRNLLKDYYQSLITHVTRDHKRLQSMEAEMERILMTRGEVPKHQKELFESRNIEFQKLWSSTQQFADMIDEDLPELKTRTSKDFDALDSSKGDGVMFDLNNRFRGDSSSANVSHTQLWEDEETRTFYENLPDLKSIIPAILYKDSLKDVPTPETTDSSTNVDHTNGDNETRDTKETDDSNKVTKEINDEILDKQEEIAIDDFVDTGKDVANLNENDELEIALYSIQKTESKKRPQIQDDENKGDQQSTNKVSNNEQQTNQQSQKSNTTSTKGQLDIFFASLLNCVNRDFIDKAALTFATTYNTKNNRKKLVNALFTVPRTRLDLLPFYGRFVAQLNPIMPSVGTDLVAILKHNFRYLFKKKDQINLESKVKNIRFIGELVKFGIFPKPDVLYILKTLLSDFRYHYVEMTCNLFETCGQYLYRSPDSYFMTNHLLDQMMRHKNRMALDSRYAIMIENAYYVVNPPEDKLLSRNIPTKPPMHLFIEDLIYKELTKSTTSKVLMKLRKLNWKDPEISSYVVKCLSSVWNLKYTNILYLAHLLFGLYSYHEWVIPRVLDTVLEDIRLGLQINSIEFNQRRIAVIKFFAECFNYRLIDLSLLFRVLYMLITYGINYSDITLSPLDPPANLMRLRLAAQILHTCGNFLNNGLSRKKLGYYLFFFQRYYWLKKSYLMSMPLDQTDKNAQFYIDVIFKDVINYLKPKFKIADSYEKACKQLEDRVKSVAEKAKEIMPNSNISVEHVLNPNHHHHQSNMTERKVSTSLDPIAEEDSLEDECVTEMEINGGNDESMSDNESNEDEEIDSDRDGMNGMEYDGETNDRHASDSDNDMPVEQPMKTPTIIQCAEDDEFQRDFEKMIRDSFTSRTQEVVRPNVEIVIPIERDDRKKSQFKNVNRNGRADGNLPFSFSLKNQIEEEQQSNTVKFRIMARNAKSNKPQLKSIEVSPESELVQKFLAREEAHRAEKEAVKRLILDINQRRELEDNSCGSPIRSNDSSNSRSATGQQQSNNSGYYYRSGASTSYNNNNVVNYQNFKRRNN